MNNEKQAIALQEKMEFYFVGLVFTILGLSIQTKPTLQPLPWLYVETLGWLLLLLAGLSGLRRLESLFIHFKHHARKDNLQGIEKNLTDRKKLEDTQKQVGTKMGSCRYLCIAIF